MLYSSIEKKQGIHLRKEVGRKLDYGIENSQFLEETKYSSRGHN